MSDLTDAIAHDKAILDHVREHLAGRHEENRDDCMACQLVRLGDAFDREVDQFRAELAEARELILDLTDEDPCSFDHHGYCQVHGWLTEGECPDARAKRFLAPAVEPEVAA